jgi:hypothetical protein
MEIYTFSERVVNVPQLPLIDVAAEARERAYEELKRRLNWAEIRREWATRMLEQWMEPTSLLHATVVDLMALPLVDEGDRDSWQKRMPTRMKIALGEMLMTLLSEVQLAAARAIDRPF